MNHARPIGEPPDWTPILGFALIPIGTLAAGLVGYLAGPPWALGALYLTVFFFVLILGIWASPTDYKGRLMAILVAVGGAMAALAGLAGTVWVGVQLETQPPGSATTTAAVSPVPPTSSEPGASTPTPTTTVPPP